MSVFQTEDMALDVSAYSGGSSGVIKGIVELYYGNCFGVEL